MRTIKFRAQCSATTEWVYGLPTTETTISNSISHISQFSGDERKFGRHNVKINPDTVGQFTGLQDKNGKDIYEGDILGDWTDVDGKMEQSRQVVFWHEVEGQWMLDNSFHQDRSHFFSLAGELKDFEYEIIGNIHATPELLNN